MIVLVEQLTYERSADLVECCVCAIRNLCINSQDHQEELMRCQGMVPLLQLLHCNTRPQLLEYVASAIAKVRAPCAAAAIACADASEANGRRAHPEHVPCLVHGMSAALPVALLA